ncbi:YdcF family protein [Hyphomicrobium sp.]|uniref:YdcF family protein n=1 Tax=Hyphomicrobium sp. TaxID=82 RepID=UPI000F9D8CAD|nr:YdcF family protein [Hyphomicrobium sp.]RUO99406.1 MAG: YdcF family protein [Hyphomicrobium sp.]
MFFVASKVIFFCVQPSSIAFLSLLLGGLFMRRSPRWARRFLGVGFGIILLFGFLPGGNILVLPLEERFATHVPSVPQGTVSGIILLGGFEDISITRARGGLALNEAAERLTEALRLARELPDARVIFTGGSGSLFGHGGVADAVRDFFIDAGIAPNRILIESDARNTYENAVLTKRLLHPEPGTRWILVTSAYHMPRSVGVFREAGYDVIPFPVDFRTRGSQDAWRPFDSIAAGLQRTDLAVKEWMGLLAYWVTGRSSALFPSASEKS